MSLTPLLRLDTKSIYSANRYASTSIPHTIHDQYLYPTPYPTMTSIGQSTHQSSSGFGYSVSRWWLTGSDRSQNIDCDIACVRNARRKIIGAHCIRNKISSQSWPTQYKLLETDLAMTALEIKLIRHCARTRCLSRTFDQLAKFQPDICVLLSDWLCNYGGGDR
jgi:hypothetical protein